MAIGLKDIDPVIADRFRRLIEGFHKNKYIHDDIHPRIPKRLFKKHEAIINVRNNIKRHFNDPLVSVLVKLFICLTVTGAVSSIFIAPHQAEIFWSSIIFFAISLLLINITSKIRRRLKRKQLETTLPSYILDHLCAICKSSDIESLYTELLPKLTSSDLPLDEMSVRQILDDMNTLLRDYRDLEKRSSIATANLSSDKDTAIINEIASLESQINAECDPLVKKSIEDTLSLALMRLENNRSVQTSYHRIQVHKEAIRQTFVSIRSSLINSMVTEGTQASLFTRNAKDIVVDITNRTKAVEETAQEILHLYQ